MSGHTPGPWTHLSGAPYSVWKGEKQIASCRWYVETQFAAVCADHDTAEANARLIAAAPDMYAALRTFVARAKSWHEFHHGSSTVQCDDLCAAIAAGEAAIAKAVQS